MKITINFLGIYFRKAKKKYRPNSQRNTLNLTIANPQKLGLDFLAPLTFERSVVSIFQSKIYNFKDLKKPSAYRISSLNRRDRPDCIIINLALNFFKQKSQESEKNKIIYFRFYHRDSDENFICSLYLKSRPR